MNKRFFRGFTRWVPAALGLLAVVATLGGGVSPARAEEEKEKGFSLFPLYPLGELGPESRFSDKPSPFLSEGDIPERPPLLLEIGDEFLAPGKLYGGFELPTGAVWQPRLGVFGTLRTAVQTFDQGDPERISEWVSRLDLFVNLQLTGTEKLIVGFRPLDRNSFPRFTKYLFEPQEGFRPDFGGDVRTLFFEGDFGSLFPNLDKKGVKLIDYGFSVGRQIINFQEGILINDTIDTVGIVRNNLHIIPGFSNVRITGLYAWDSVSRPSRAGFTGRAPEVNLFGLFTQGDAATSTFALDAIYVESDQANSEAFYIGGSAIQRIGKFNTALRVNSSFAMDDETALVGDGTLFSLELSFTPQRSDDVVYLNSFWALGTMTQAAREPIVGGPLASLGINFASPSIGDHLSELSSFANDAVGGALGYQAFWDSHRRNLVLEVAGRLDTEGDDATGFDGVALGAQFQQAIGQRVQLQIDAFVAFQETQNLASGGRFEILVQF
jgi:hypothetical protein